MSLETKYNLRSPAVKRLMREASELRNPTEEYFACPVEDNLFEWHFTIRGPPDTEFEGGFYHGRIQLPPQYPMQPPNIILLTPNGRFQVNKKICLSISGYHPESWQPSWSIRTALLALIAFMPTKAGGTVGSLDYTPEERQVMAQASKNWECLMCGKVADTLLTGDKATSPALTEEESSLLQSINLKAEDDPNRKREGETGGRDSDELTDLRLTTPPVTEGIEDRLRYRQVQSDASERTPEARDANEDASYQRNDQRDIIWSLVIYLILLLIALLLIRRLFFL